MIPIVIQANAKINLALDVIKKRDDGLHELDMLNIPIKLHDTIELTQINNPHANISYLYCDDPNIECDETNTAYQAFSLYRQKCKIKETFRIFVYKRIPIQAGLGGGSSDAAAVLKALQEFTKDKSTPCDIFEMAKSIGADVPFSLVNKPARVQGFGEKISPINFDLENTKYYVLIIKPKEGLSTTDVYSLYDKMDPKEIKHPNIDNLIEALKNQDQEGIKKNLINSLYYPAVKQLPLIKDILDKLDEFNLPLNGMSGSGSACFALAKKKAQLKKAYKFFAKQPGYFSIISEFVL